LDDVPGAKGIPRPLGIAWLIVIFAVFGFLLFDQPAYDSLVVWLQHNQAILPIGLGLLGFVMIGLMVLTLIKYYAPRKPRTIPM
jgi:predicted tellurium resistance membrane protein TerC